MWIYILEHMVKEPVKYARVHLFILLLSTDLNHEIVYFSFLSVWNMQTVHIV